MKKQDTMKLVKECDAGVKMGVASIDSILDYVHTYSLKSYLRDCKIAHEKLGREIETLLDHYHEEGKNPNPIATGIAKMKTNIRLALDESDKTVADVVSDGCHMGVKSLHRYLNQYEHADEKSKNITQSLIRQEEQLAVHLRKFL